LPTISVVLPAIAAVLASYYSCAPIFLGPLRSAWPIGLARLRIHLPTISVVLANHFGCACQLLQLCLPAITAVPPIFLGPLRSAWPIGLARLRIHLPTIPVVLANHFGCACQLL
jgi:hypothetical protein